MDTTGKTRAEIDALRALAAKAHEEGASFGAAWSDYHVVPLGRVDREQRARQWAEEELPYPADQGVHP